MRAVYLLLLLSTISTGPIRVRPAGPDFGQDPPREVSALPWEVLS